MKTHAWKVVMNREGKSQSIFTFGKIMTYKIGETSICPSGHGLYCWRTRKDAREYKDHQNERIIKIEVRSNDLIKKSGDEYRYKKLKVVAKG